jgi:hypothetical protein
MLRKFVRVNSKYHLNGLALDDLDWGKTVVSTPLTTLVFLR